MREVHSLTVLIPQRPVPPLGKLGSRVRVWVRVREKINIASNNIFLNALHVVINFIYI
jgi:hypothetical protein